jgi:hypothetical protein
MTQHEYVFIAISIILGLALHRLSRDCVVLGANL